MCYNLIIKISIGGANKGKLKKYLEVRALSISAKERGAGGPDPPPLKIHKNIGFLCNTGPAVVDPGCALGASPPIVKNLNLPWTLGTFCVFKSQHP